jgi:hypothetical protein
MREMYVSIARDFSPHPGPRYRRQGPASGEEFRALLVEWLKQAERLIVDLDGTSGFGSSFLDEAFGGLIRNEGLRREDLAERLVIKSDMDESYLEEVREALELARPL